ncbi:DUF3040 domain-containing protein [Catellatospora bangladeshensis]|uniref:DUF3040 domain-containing protein n=1 Tax=Catellatospora bangladeshensis TaxID=310355 RepID=A0A8J3JCI1_9ACTN|nr:DUF3040 domain-containing protein [Catellatospora bangladeshensis]GIF82352.1 hypothetical protein Cba03nite_37010 [Catellatospora bangladeshensis]
MPLQPEELARLEVLAAQTRTADPSFVFGLSTGNACAPVEYRRRAASRLGFALAAASLLLAVVLLLVGWLGGGLVALFAAAGAATAARRAALQPGIVPAGRRGAHDIPA